MKRIASYLTTIVVAIFTTLLIITCSKEYSFEGGLSTPAQSSVYTFIASAGNCSVALVSGIYKVGKALDASNTVKLSVHVTRPGTYYQSTNTINGFNFSGSGVFADTGVQTIDLTASGTAISDGNFAFNTTGDVCGFAVAVEKASPNLATFTLSGEPGECQNAVVNGNYVNGDAMKATNYVELMVSITSTGPYSIKTDTLNGISFQASGNFTSTGIQTVLLNSQGTPNQPGIFTFTPKAGSPGCTFDIAVTNSGPLATYVLESGFGNPSPCIYTVNGLYTKGLALSGSNTVKINAYVTVVGNFTVETNTVNGTRFSFSGSFTTPGPQTILLSGGGVPTSIGTFAFIPQIVGPHPLGGQSCAFEVPVK